VGQGERAIALIERTTEGMGGWASGWLMFAEFDAIRASRRSWREQINESGRGGMNL